MDGVVIRRLGPGERDAIVAASPLLDGPALPEVADQFLDAPDHHFLVAYQDGKPVGFVSGVETIHPDKGTEMFLYELAVDETARRQGIGSALVVEMRRLALDRGCYGMWVVTDHDNAGARATYEAAGAPPASSHVMYTWELGEH
jgi:ribosomal protein S18 acetylase RimI-like enzyme